MVSYKHIYIYEIEGEVKDGMVNSPDYIGCWNEGESSFLFFHTEQNVFVKHLIKQYPFMRLVDAYDMDYKDWQGGSLKSFRVGPLWFCPLSGDVAQKPEGCLMIPFDPGVVFGTGLHPTTIDCIHLIVELFQKHTPKTVLDLGTGTGILALTCAVLGAKKILAVDINRLSVKTAMGNVIRNGLEGKITVEEAPAEDVISENADLAVMNIHYRVLDRLIETEGFHEKKWIVLSGVLRTDYMKLLRKLQKNLHLVRELHTGHWFTAWFEK